MAQYKDEKTGKWYYSYISVAGTHLTKRGFATKGLAKKAEEAENGENEEVTEKENSEEN